MDEAYIQTQVIKRTNSLLRGAVVLNHSDKSTSSIPDVSISVLGYTAWVELKYLRKGRSLRNIIEVGQILLCNQLSTTTEGRCWIVVFDEHKHRTTVWIPRVLFKHLYPQFAQDGGPWNVLHKDPVDVNWTSDKPLGLLMALNACGAVHVPGWHYDIVPHLVKQAAA